MNVAEPLLVVSYNCSQTNASHFKVSFTQVVQVYSDICLKMCDIMGDISLAVSFSILAGALLEFKASSCFMMPFSPISRV